MEHGFADYFDGGEALAHEVVVEGLEVEGLAPCFLPCVSSRSFMISSLPSV